MPTELVLFSDRAPTADTLARAAADAHPDGSLLEFHDGLVRQVVDAQGRGLLSVWTSRPVVDRFHVAASAARAPQEFTLWTDLTIPFGDPTAGRAVAEQLAALVGGVVRDRI
ncbi:hypothetical protein [Cellulomonas sp. NPDC089187]|uniref:hypothetical protein n=1 Tax=Cellulomonas sp. NPDC089187 TaxID=3154970 RepID=UPI00343A78F7